jgi:arylsulfatase A-like enzyme
VNGGGNVWGITLEAPQRYQDSVSLSLPHGPAFNQSNPSLAAMPQWVRDRPPLTDGDATCAELQYRRRIEALRAFDDMVQLIFSQLDASNLTQRTVVIFTSDNGYLRGEHRLLEKSAPYEESIRVPLVIRGPWPAHHVSQMVNAADIAPTIAEIAGAVPNQPADGRSLVSLLQSPNPGLIPWRNVMEVESFESALDGIADTVNYGAYPLINSPFIGVRMMKPARLYVRFTDTGERELYDLAADPFQVHNLAGDASRAREVQLLDAIAVALQGCQNFGCLLLESLFKLK